MEKSYGTGACGSYAVSYTHLLGLPDMDGVEVIQKIRTWSNMPIIVISARSEDTDKIDALDAGCLLYTSVQRDPVGFDL